MKIPEGTGLHETLNTANLDRRHFLTKAGTVGFGLAAAGVMAGSPNIAQAQSGQSQQMKDTITEIYTAFLIAEDLATTFYYNGLVGAVIQDPSLAGPGGTATQITASGNFGNVNYLQAALTEEISHASLLRSGLRISHPSGDPVQTFYFPTGTFDTLGAFTSLLDALENAFIGAYITVIQEVALKAAYAQSQGDGLSASQLAYFAKVAAATLGIECEHRVLGRVISNSNPANNLLYEQTDGLTAIYNGPNSAVVALTPFLTPSTGPGYSLATALANQGSVSVPVTGKPPAA